IVISVTRLSRRKPRIGRMSSAGTVMGFGCSRREGLTMVTSFVQMPAAGIGQMGPLDWAVQMSTPDVRHRQVEERASRRAGPRSAGSGDRWHLACILLRLARRAFGCLVR